MIYAKNDYENKLKATPGSKAYCPSCNGDVIAKCGEIKIWHWAHVSADCDSWCEGETDWHLGWKSKFWPDQTEVVIENHRADIVLGKTVWEVQHSPISPEMIREREQFYKGHGYKLEWLFDMKDLYLWGKRSFDISDRGRYATFKWNWAHKSLIECNNIHFDLGDYSLSVKKQYQSMHTGWGYINDNSDFIEIIMKGKNIKDRILKEYCPRCTHCFCAVAPTATYCDNFKERIDHYYK